MANRLQPAGPDGGDPAASPDIPWDRIVLLTKGSFRTFWNYRILLEYGFLAGLCAFVIYWPFKWLQVFPGIQGIVGHLMITTETGTIFWIVLFFIISVISTYLLVLLNSGSLYSVMEISAHRAVTLRQSLRFAIHRMPHIYSYILLDAAVIFLPRAVLPFFPEALSTALNLDGIQIIEIVFGILTYFVLPILVFEPDGLCSSLKRSLLWLKQFWAESVAGAILFTLLLYLVATALFFLVYLPLVHAGLIPVSKDLDLFTALAVGIAEAITSIPGHLYNFGLYSYARDGEIPPVLSGPRQREPSDDSDKFSVD
jgi:hypothetical protein